MNFQFAMWRKSMFSGGGCSRSNVPLGIRLKDQNSLSYGENELSRYLIILQAYFTLYITRLMLNFLSVSTAQWPTKTLFRFFKLYILVRILLKHRFSMKCTYWAKFGQKRGSNAQANMAIV